MDTTEVYIKMRIAAIPNLGIGVIPHKLHFHSHYWVDEKGDFYVITPGEPHYCHLERQDQLQAMMKGEKHMHLLAYEFAAYFHGTDDPLYFDVGRDNFTVDSDNSMEQMWLAFVMREKFNKVWDGNEWINSN
uniref:Uncharacterized protein n=1 Tax=viral metagenome TaxID=1070528 RepID=A0A6M3LMK8_9ZZZZ